MAIIYLLLLYVIIAPLIGCILIEFFNFYSYSSGKIGYFNGSWIAYLWNSLIFIVFTYLIAKAKINYGYGFLKNKLLKYRFQKKTVFRIIICLFLFFLLMLFFFGGYKVLLGKVSKGEFRSEEIGVLGLGFFAYMITKFIVPSLLAFLVYVHKYINPLKKRILFAYFFLTSAIGFMWGFKSSAITILLPALIILFDRIKIMIFISIFIMCFILIYITGYLFDKDILQTYNISLLNFIFLRMTVIEGDTYWYIFDKIISNEISPLYEDYFKYFLSFFGNKLLNILGIDLSNPQEKIEYSLSAYITYLVTDDLYQSTSGQHNLTITYVGEGLLFLGYPGVILFSVFAGIITGLNILIFRQSLYRNPIIASLSSSCFVFMTWSWLKGGDLTCILHISNLIGIILTYVILKLTSSKIKINGYIL